MSTAEFSKCEACGWAIYRLPDEPEGEVWFHWNKPHAGNNRYCLYMNHDANRVIDGWAYRADKGPQARPTDRVHRVIGFSDEDQQRLVDSLNNGGDADIIMAAEASEDAELPKLKFLKLDAEELTQEDPVNHPRHYTSHPSGVECKDIIKHYPVPIAFAIKYLWRAGIKNSDLEIQDLEKAVFWINEQIEDLKHGPKQYELDLGIEAP